MQKKGFTLIELLVVIAIIGILTSVVLASLNSARSKGGDAAVKANLSTVRTSAEQYYDTNKNYGSSSSVCTGGMFADANIDAAIDQAVAQGGGAAQCESTGSAYAVAVPLKSSASTFWCVDSSGVATSTAGVSSDPISATAKCQ